MNNVYLKWPFRMIKAMVKNPYAFAQLVKSLPSACSGIDYSRSYCNTLPKGENAPANNPLWQYFQNHKEGRGLLKWEHYFEVYHRHLARFVGQEVSILEIGIYSGGSLDMWRTYFGDKSHIYGVDIDPSCQAYANEHVSVFIGDQEDRGFWRNFRQKARDIDIIIDDGGHTAEQQQVTLEEMLPHLRPGGVYLCEDVHGTFHRFPAFAAGLVNGLNEWEMIPGPLLQSRMSPFQASIHSIHFYPYITVIENNSVSRNRLAAPRHGTEWLPT